MKQIEINNQSDMQIIEEVKKIILDKYPIVEDRMDILFNYPAPAMGIIIDLYNYGKESQTYINFTSGNQTFQMSTQDKVIIDELISLNSLNGIIEFILNDHECISNFYKTNNTISLKFMVNMKDDNMHGISCSEIELKLIVYGDLNKKEILNYYLKGISNRFFEQLKNTETFKNEYKQYIAREKAQIINSLTEEEIRLFISILNTADLCDMILNMPDERFQEVYQEYDQMNKEKTLIKQKENNNKK